MNNNNLDNKEIFVKKYVEDDGSEKEEEIFFKSKRFYRYKENYMSLFQGKFMEEKIKLKDIKTVFGSRTHLMFYLLNNMNTDNAITLPRKRICEDLGINESMLSKHLRKLNEIKIIELQNHNIIFNNNFVSKGRVKDHPNSY